MASNPIGFEITCGVSGWNNSDFDDVFVRKECFLEGGLWTWGSNFYGELGRNGFINIAASSPVQTVSGGTNWRQVTATSANIIALKTDGTLWTWGRASFGILGNNNSTVNRSSPVQTVSGGTNWKQISAGGATVAAVKEDGSLWLWGSGAAGRRGDNVSTGYNSSPVQTVSNVTTWKSVSVGGTFGAAIKTDGTLWTWGNNQDGALGINSILNRSSPVQTISGGTNWKQVSTGTQNTVAIKTDGTLWLWGYGAGRLGNNIGGTGGRSSPVQTVSGGTNWKDVAMSGGVVLSVKTDGTLWAWGNNPGNNIFGIFSSPVQTISGGTNWRCVSKGSSLATAFKADGTVWVWGSNLRGELGNNSTTAVSSPVQFITGGTNWVSVGISSSGISAGIREDCW